jgi:phosphatidylinositol alpha-mannosyltransferase
MRRSVKQYKIGFILDDGLDKPDGVQQYILSLGEWLRAKGHDVHYLVGETSRQDLINVHSLSRNLRVRFNGGNRLSIPFPTSRRKLRKFLKRQRFDILHVQVPYSPLMGGRLVSAASKRTAIVGTFHIAPYSPFISFGTRLLGFWSRPTLRRFHTMLSVSTTAAVFARQTFGIDSQLLPNTIDYDWFHKAKPLPAYADDTLTILFLGRLVPRKGCQLLLTAAGMLAQRRGVPRFRLVICGTGPDEKKLQRMVERFGIQDLVSFVGFVSEQAKPRYYASADVSVFPSNGGESFGIVLLEAMATGKAAVLAGDNPGYRSVLLEKPELLFNPQDAGELADKLETALRNKQWRLQAKRWAGRYAKQYDVNVVGTQLLAVYRQALHKAGRR